MLTIVLPSTHSVLQMEIIAIRPFVGEVGLKHSIHPSINGHIASGAPRRATSGPIFSNGNFMHITHGQ